MAADEGERKLAAILAADVAGYSRLMADDDRATIRALTDYREVFSERVAAHKGHIVDTAGDSVLATFDSVVEAVEAAVEVQGVLSERNEALPDHRRMHFRIGVNLGDIIIRDDGTVYGDGVNVAARLEGLAAAGGVMISQTAYDQVEGRLAVGLADSGEHEVKNIVKPVRAYRVLLDGSTASTLAQERTTAPVLRRPKVITGLAVALAIIIALAVWGITIRVEAPQMVNADATPAVNSVLTLPSGPSIAVLPFADLSGDPEQDYFADGLTEEIISRLSRFRELLVFARASTQVYKGRTATPQEVHRDLGAQFMLEGSVRRAGDRIRVSARLVEAETGIQRWTETYDRALEDIFALQDEITDRIVVAVGGNYSAIVSSRAAESPSQPAQSVAAYDLAMRALMYYDEESAERHARARADAERAAEIEPDSAFIQAVLAYMYLDEVRFDYSPRPSSLDEALSAARRAVNLDRNSAVAQSALAIVHFHRGKFDQFLGGCERVIALNPNAADFVAECAEKMVQMGLIERGEPLIQHARAINPHHAPWYHYATALIEFDRGNYESALAAVSSIDAPDFASPWLYRAALSAAVGRQAEAEVAIEQLHRVDPEYTIAKFIDIRRRIWHWPQERTDQWTALLRQAGLPDGTPTH
jgi:adenylate cyclase